MFRSNTVACICRTYRVAAGGVDPVRREPVETLQEVGESCNATHVTVSVCGRFICFICRGLTPLTLAPIFTYLSAVQDYDDMLALRHAAALLYELYVSTGDERFYGAREALIKELPPNLFEPPYPMRSGNPTRENVAGSISPRSDSDPQDT